ETQVVSPELFAARVTEWAVHGDTPFPFGIAASSDGKLYVADNGMGRLLIIDPKAEDVRPFELSQPGIDEGVSPRGIAEGPEGKLIDLTRNRPQDYLAPWTQRYAVGIDIDRSSGDAWYSKLYANKIGHINAKTLAVEEFTPPQMGPRGMAFDKHATLWVA